MNVKKLFALKAPCKNCPFLKENGIELVEGRLDSIKEDLINNDETPFFVTKQRIHQVVFMTKKQRHM
ncbi:hypothetical protein [Escherichia coli]|uniref:hypothetical protein n=1 Tax=Escherichia coli TaxID=562 RepID=UPI002805024F|nr:hypothetical protein [Escherichia coli]